MVGWIENELHVNDEWDHVKGVFVSCWENATICKKGMEEGKNGLENFKQDSHRL